MERVWYVDGLRTDYRLILIDTRGHSASGKPPEPEGCRRTTLVADVVDVLDDLPSTRRIVLAIQWAGS